MKNRMGALVIICALVFTLCGPVQAEASMTAYTVVEGAKVYDDSGKALGTLPVNTKLSVTGVKGNICRVERDGRTGYMKKDELAANPVSQAAGGAGEAAPADQTEARTAYVARDGAKVYDANGKPGGSLAINTKLTVTGTKGNICRVEKDGKTAYMKKNDLSASPVAETQSGSADGDTGHTAYVRADGAKLYSADGKATDTLSLNTMVRVTGVKGDICRVERDGKTGYMKKSDLSAQKTQTASEAAAGESGLSPARGTAVEMDWWTSDIRMIFDRGVVAQITDVETGLTWREKRFGGTNHADCQPLTAADTAAMKKAYGGEWSWNRRAVFVTIDGVNYAASINGMPHGSGSIKDNDFNGHHCIHFTNSRTHGSNKVCPLHQAAIKKAASTRL